MYNILLCTPRIRRIMDSIYVPVTWVNKDLRGNPKGEICKMQYFEERNYARGYFWRQCSLSSNRSSDKMKVAILRRGANEKYKELVSNIWARGKATHIKEGIIGGFSQLIENWLAIPCINH